MYRLKLAKLIYLGTALTNQNDIHDEIKSTLNSWNACYYSVQNLYTSRLISKNLKIKIYKTVTFPVLLYGCETWSVTLGEERRLRVFGNRGSRKGPKREEDGSWRNLHNDELHSLYSSPNIVRVTKSRRMRWAGHVAHMEEGRGIYEILLGRPDGKRRPRRMWEDNIKTELREIGIDGVNWIQLAQDRFRWWGFVITVMNLPVQ
jgi:hypothetical protein